MLSALAISGLLYGCVTISDIDTSKYESTCIRECANTFSHCTSAVGVHFECKDAYGVCVGTCPMKTGELER